VVDASFEKRKKQQKFISNEQKEINEE